MDLDHFKHVNDNFGHPMGDRVLSIFAELVRDSVRSSDLFIRRGGEEFLLIAPSTPIDAAAKVAERIRSGLEGYDMLEEAGAPIDQTVSIGVVQWSWNETAEELEERCDKAMYRAKRLGRNCLFVDEDR